MTDEREGIYLKEYLEVHNAALRKDPSYRPDMELTHVTANGDLVQRTRDNVLAPEDDRMFIRVRDVVRAK